MKFFILFYSCLLWAEGPRDEIQALSKKGHRPLNYKQAREVLFGRIFLKKDEKGFFIQDIYCEMVFRDSVGPNKIPNPNKLNTEHSWPKKFFSKSYPYKMQESDLFHLYPTDTIANSCRGHLIFQEVDSSEEIPNCDLSKRGTDSSKNYGFEPPDRVKGDLARSLFYFSVRYNVNISYNEETILRKWSLDDPVDSDEKLKNNLIMEAQGNRNPFIDQEDLIFEIKDF